MTDLQDEDVEVEIAVIKLPHISNFTDLEPFEQEPKTGVRYITQRDQLGNPDLIIIPGSKNTIDDLLYLQETGLAAEIEQAAEKSVPVIGVCGGYQMLGQKVYDPEGTESNWQELDGLGLLPIETTFSPNKLTFQAEAVVKGSGEFFADLTGSEVAGYEIHMGTSQLISDNSPAFRIKKRGQEEVNIADGAVSQDGLVFGTYLHGIFANDNFRRNLINRLRERKGLERLKADTVSHQVKLEESYEQLAAIVRDNLDLDQIYRIME